MALYIGLMSGTSMDGIDAALVDMPSNKLIHGLTVPYHAKVRELLGDLVFEQQSTVSMWRQLDTLIGREFANAVQLLLKESGYCAEQITAIGSHGQTISHDADADIPYTLQLGCPHTIAALTNIDVVADFRTRDLVNGGQGAPFAPLYHQEVFKKGQESMAVVNIGGIANVTLLIPGEPTRGWDVGPGNCLLDEWINKIKNTSYDKNGEWAAQGSVLPLLLEQLLADPFFQQPEPKSIGKEYFSLSWLEPHLLPDYQAVDVQATLLALTAITIAQSIESRHLKQLYVCGGGVHNNRLLEYLADKLPQLQLKSVMDLGVNPDFLEAMMFAWLASQTIQHKPVDLTCITGANKPSILGAIYLAH